MSERRGLEAAVEEEGRRRAEEGAEGTGEEEEVEIWGDSTSETSRAIEYADKRHE